MAVIQPPSFLPDLLTNFFPFFSHPLLPLLLSLLPFLTPLLPSLQDSEASAVKFLKTGETVISLPFPSTIQGFLIPPFRPCLRLSFLFILGG